MNRTRMALEAPDEADPDGGVGHQQGLVQLSGRLAVSGGRLQLELLQDPHQRQAEVLLREPATYTHPGSVAERHVQVRVCLRLALP